MSTVTDHATVAELRGVGLFDGVDDAALERWAPSAILHVDPAGTRLREEGGGRHGVVLLLDGQVEMLARDGEIEVRQGIQTAPTWIGATATLLGTVDPLTLRAETELRYAVIDPEPFIELVRTERAVFDRVMAALKPVMVRVGQRQQQQDRLESLGTMAAGLAHELNNPASAAKQAARELAATLAVLSSTVAVFVESGVEREEASRLVALQQAALERCRNREAQSALQSADREDALGDALTDLGVPEPWNVAATLAAGGMQDGDLEEIAATAGPLTIPVVRWIAATLAANQLAAELADSTERMSDLVIAIKRYAYAKPGQLDEVDLRDGIETTLTLLKHKLKHTSITVVRDYDPALAPATVYSSELNQVWTNLLDNAIDALGGSGTLTITTRADGDCAEVDIADDGPEIPPEVRRRVFDPFFTTKEVGKGTGLGLDTARRIVVDRHHGSLSVESDAALTVFRVRIPLRPAAR